MNHLRGGKMDSKLNEPTHRRQASRLVVHLAWSILAGLVMVAVLAASLGVILGVLFRDFRLAMSAAGLVFFAVLGVAPIVIVDYVQQEWKRISREDEQYGPVSRSLAPGMGLFDFLLRLRIPSGVTPT
jgi:archaellum biogenesis protein FlaJ (TadC family)